MELSKRQIGDYLWDEELINHKMIFLSGPRQVGKTTYAKGMISSKSGAYFSWDNPKTRKNYARDAFFFLRDRKADQPYLVIFDEIHKRPKWKDILKGLHDTLDTSCRLFITGSARLEWFRKSGDSLVGRYAHFHMMPVSLAEMLKKPVERLWLGQSSDWLSPWKSFNRKIRDLSRSKENRDLYEHLFHFSGFPEPLTRSSQRFFHKWQKDYLSLMLTEDLRDITNIKTIDAVEQLIELLPERIGAPLSINSLAKDLETSHPTLKNYILQLERLWLLFTLRPWSRQLQRSLKKEKKAYFVNWVYAADPPKIFENMIAASLLKSCFVWTDTALGDAQLWYVRSFDGAEVDFLITLNKKPVLLVEAKMSDAQIGKTTHNFSERLNVPVVQVIHTPGIARFSESSMVLSADKFLSVLP